MTAAQVLDCVQISIHSLILFFVQHKILTCKRRPALIIPIFSLIQVLLYYLTCYSDFVSRYIMIEARMSLKALLTAGTFALFIFVFCSESIVKKLQTFVFYNIFVIFVECIFVVIVELFTKTTLDEFRNKDIKSQIICGFSMAFLYCLAAVLTYIVCKRAQLTMKSKQYILITAMVICLGFVSCFCPLVLNNMTSDSSSTSTSFLIIGFIIVALACFLIALIIFILIKRTSEYEALKEKLFWSEQTQDLQMEYYNSIKKKTDSIREIRHDFKDTLSTVNMLISNNSEDDNAAAIALIDELNNRINRTKFEIYTENTIVNTVIGIKIEEYVDQNIQWDIKLDLPKKFENIDAYDLNSLFINLLSNAAEACVKVEPKDRVIKIHAGCRGGYLIVKTENSFAQIVKNDKGELVTTKGNKERHGIGTILIKNIVQKYNGSYKVETEGNIFRCIVSVEC